MAVLNLMLMPLFVWVLILLCWLGPEKSWKKVHVRKGCLCWWSCKRNGGWSNIYFWRIKLANISPYQRVFIVSNSLLCIQTLRRPNDNYLEVGHVLKNCRTLLESNIGFSISFVKRKAIKVAHEVANIPYLLNFPKVFTPPPSVLLETIMYDFPH